MSARVMGATRQKGTSMKTKLLAAAAFSVFGLTQPALAQDSVGVADGDSWTGPYVGLRAGVSDVAGGNNESVLFDTNLDGTFDDTVRTGAGVNAFGPGFCGGRATAPTAVNGCREDAARLEFGAHAGFDYDFGGLVAGVVGEVARSNVRDSVTAFSTTPANYVLTRQLREQYAVRARAGVGLGDALLYATGGGVHARVRNTFSSTNTANDFSGTRTKGEWGYQLGGGLEYRTSANFSIGALFLMTNVDADSYRVDVTRGRAPATNPFVLVNPNGTTFARSDEDFEQRSVTVTASYRF